ncbi:ParB/RepB/Spo0J family partition protein [Salipiger sp. P9]|uniref:ParB/RepB/Spo0J family partition protein n=1 Tax=Salipiger pentaromativorans TaxID=2943193 RepID=UPI0021582536|nr:ParB/RepB/Spo0J family partition protein [Salipiger pentaromativorans]MCR8549545.1 ParB/RepB/Spo0J family partition protein [Salipiger pentaromativorans]
MADKKETRRGLGRGLSALMSDVDMRPAPESDEAAPKTPDRLVPIEKLAPNKDQPRRSFTPEQLQELSDSIRAKGILQPIIVRPAPGGEGQFEIVAGERRWRAAQMAQLHEVPVLVRDLDDQEMLEIAIIENIQRADLNAIEEAAGYRQLMYRFGHTQEKIAEALGKSRSHIANLLRLLNLPEPVQEHVRAGDLSAGHARTLVTARDPERMAEEIIRKKLSVRQAEALLRAETQPPQRKTPAASFVMEKDADTKALEGDLSAALGMKVTVSHKPGAESGTLSISYGSFEELDSLCMILSAAR